MVEIIFDTALLVTALLSFISASKPQKVAFGKWIHFLIKRERKFRKERSLLKACRFILKLDIRISKTIGFTYGQILSKIIYPLTIIGRGRSKITTAIIYLVFSGPILFTYFNTKVLYSVDHLIFCIFLICPVIIYFFYVFLAKYNQRPHEYEGVRGMICEVKGMNILDTLVFKIFSENVLLFDKNGRRYLFQKNIRKISLLSASILIAIPIIYFYPRSISVVLNLGPIGFYSFTAIFGPAYFMMISLGVILSIWLPIGILNNFSFPKNSKKYAKFLLYVTLSTSISYILYYSGFLENNEMGLQKNIIPVFVNIILDSYIVIIFSYFVIKIFRVRHSRDKGIAVSKEFFLFSLRSAIAGFLSIYASFKFTGIEFGLIESARLFVGVHPFQNKIYTGSFFLLTHTALIPFVILAAYPTIVYVIKMVRFYAEVMLIRASRSGNPATYISAIVLLTLGVWRLFI